MAQEYSGSSWLENTLLGTVIECIYAGSSLPLCLTSLLNVLLDEWRVNAIQVPFTYTH